MKSLFDMMYSPKELAREIGVSLDLIYRGYIPLGCPHERNDKNYILINGKAFSIWYEKTYVKLYLEQDETFCKTCRKAVKIIQPKETKKGGLVYWLSVCPVCGRKLTKIISNEGKHDK